MTKTIKELEKFMKEIKAHKGSTLDIKLQTLKEVLEMIDKEIKYYRMPLQKRLKKKLDFETGERGHKIVALIKLKSRIEGK